MRGCGGEEHERKQDTGRFSLHYTSMVFWFVCFLSVCIHAIHMERKSNAGFEEMHTMMALYRRLGCISLLCVRCAALAVSIRVGCISLCEDAVVLHVWNYFPHRMETATFGSREDADEVFAATPAVASLAIPRFPVVADNVVHLVFTACLVEVG